MVRVRVRVRVVRERARARVRIKVRVKVRRDVVMFFLSRLLQQKALHHTFLLLFFSDTFDDAYIRS